MNWTRGLFRLWILASALWCLPVVMIAFVTQPQRVAYLSELCRYDVIVGTDEDDEFATEQIVASAPAAQGKEYCDPSQRVPLSPQEISNALSELQSAREKMPAERTEHWLGWAAATAIPPAVVFVLGWAFLWAFSGFRKTGP